MNNNYSLFCIIVDFGKARKMLKESKKLGASGGTFFLGKGTVESHLLDILGLNEVRKEILIMVIEEELEDIFYRELNNKFSLDKANHGIAFSMPLNICLGLENNEHQLNSKDQEVKNMKYEAIFTIVDKGMSDKVLDAAKLYGSTGGTVIHGRGSGSQDKAKLFNIEIDPEKDIVLILSEVTKTEAIINSIRKELNIDDPGTGIIFVLNVNRTLGLFQE
ncbi:MAG TPA: P-II family nitrogen regulator [Tissierellaceae bacterium]|nr:P-II family nitrogen regulator [Tissierellaceae bacterium]